QPPSRVPRHPENPDQLDGRSPSRHDHRGDTEKQPPDRVPGPPENTARRATINVPDAGRRGDRLRGQVPHKAGKALHWIAGHLPDVARRGNNGVTLRCPVSTLCPAELQRWSLHSVAASSRTKGKPGV